MDIVPPLAVSVSQWERWKSVGAVVPSTAFSAGGLAGCKAETRRGWNHYPEQIMGSDEEPAQCRDVPVKSMCSTAQPQGKHSPQSHKDRTCITTRENLTHPHPSNARWEVWPWPADSGTDTQVHTAEEDEVLLQVTPSKVAIPSQAGYPNSHSGSVSCPLGRISRHTGSYLSHFWSRAINYGRATLVCSLHAPGACWGAAVVPAPSGERVMQGWEGTSLTAPWSGHK